MKIAFHSPGDVSINAYVGGEGRWIVNWIHFLRWLGHEVQVVEVSSAPAADLIFSLDTCDAIVDRLHIHNNFSCANVGLLQFPCYKKHGTMWVSNPYRAGYESSLAWTEAHNIQQVLMPMAYPDHFLPENFEWGFSRTEITLATKGPFSPEFFREGSSQNYIPQRSLDTLNALVRLSKQVDLKVNLVLDEFFSTPEAVSLGVPGLLSQIEGLEKKGRLVWTELVKVMGGSKLNLPLGGLSGSCLESIFAQSLPVFYEDSSFFPAEKNLVLLPPVREATEQDFYEALEVFWRDEVVYRRVWEHYQDAFVEHRTDGLCRNFAETLEKVGVAA